MNFAEIIAVIAVTLISLMHSLTLTHTFTLTHTNTHILTHTHTHTHARTHTCLDTNTHTLFLIYTHALNTNPNSSSLSLTHTNSHSISPPLSHTNTHTQSHALERERHVEGIHFEEMRSSRPILTEEERKNRRKWMRKKFSGTYLSASSGLYVALEKKLGNVREYYL